MWRELNVFGVLMAPFIAYAIAALGLFLVLRPVLLLLRFHRWTWNTPLAEAAVYVCILGLMITLF